MQTIKVRRRFWGIIPYTAEVPVEDAGTKLLATELGVNSNVDVQLMHNVRELVANKMGSKLTNAFNQALAEAGIPQDNEKAVWARGVLKEVAEKIGRVAASRAYADAVAGNRREIATKVVISFDALPEPTEPAPTA